MVILGLYGCFYTLGVLVVGVLMIRPLLYLGSVKRPLFFGNYHIGELMSSCPYVEYTGKLCQHGGRW